MARYSYGSSTACPGLFDDPYSKATVAVECIEIVALIIIGCLWLGAQKRAPYRFEVLKWHNFGLAVVFWLLYVFINFIRFFLVGCNVVFTIANFWRMSIVSHIFYWIAMCLTLVAVLLAIPNGLDRLRNPAATSSSGWKRVAHVLLGLFVIFTIVYLGLFIWAYQSAIDAYDSYEYFTRSEPSAFPEYIYVYMALQTAWAVLAIAAITKMLLSLRAASAAWSVPSALRGWVYALAFSLFAYAFTRTFFVYWGTVGNNPIRWTDAFLAQEICALVLPTFFVLVALLATVQVAQSVSGVLAHPDLYGFGRMPDEADVERNQGGFDGIVR